MGRLLYQASHHRSPVFELSERETAPLLPQRYVTIFFIAGHWNYVRYIVIHVHEIGQLAEEGIKANFVKGRHADIMMEC